ncbi:MAG: TetR/AcrR family transcriptional regulator [Pseudomonadota bacterium]
MIMHGTIKPEESKITRKRLAKRDAILDEGARLINARGAACARLSEIGSTLGLSRNSLYYYVKDQTDLVRQCYARTCDTIEQNLDWVESQPVSADEKIGLFVHRILLPDHAQRAALADLAFLDEADRRDLEVRQKKHVDRLAKIIADGEADGLFKPVPRQITALAIFGMVDWVLLWSRWAFEDDDQMLQRLQDYYDAVMEFILYGFVADRHSNFSCQIKFDDLVRSEFNVFDRGDTARLRRLRLLQAASMEFNRKGVAGVSLEDIADAVGVTTGAMYHYFKDKAALIEACYERAHFCYQRISDAAHAMDCSPAVKLLTVFHVNCQAQVSSGAPLIMHPGVIQLGSDYLEQSLEVGNRIKVTLAEGRAKGDIRAGSPLLTEVTPGAFFWIPKWRAKLKDLEIDSLPDRLTSVFGSGICAT